MKIVRDAVAGTLESNDVLVSVTLGSGRLEVEVDSIVLAQFGEKIQEAALTAARETGVTDAHIRLQDRGALDCTIRARVETALRRAGEAAQ